MKEIKFRQPVFHNGDFIRFHYWGFIGDGNFVGPIPPLRKAQKDSQQFTGLRDSKGKEIYGGDVIKLDNEPNYYVIFEKGCFLGKEIKGWDSMVDNFPIGLQSQIGEVIGNVYEHPDLLKGE